MKTVPRGSSDVITSAVNAMTFEQFKRDAASAIKMAVEGRASVSFASSFSARNANEYQRSGRPGCL